MIAIILMLFFMQLFLKYFKSSKKISALKK